MQLYNGDCLEVMNDIPDKSIDMILCDPPYGIDFQSQWKKDKSQWKPKIINDKEPFIEFIPLLKRIIKPSGCVMIFTRWDVQQCFINKLTESGFAVKNVLIWDKVVHGMGDLKRAYGGTYESIIFCAEDDFLFSSKRPIDIIRITRVNPEKLMHPNEKPVELLSKLIKDCTYKNSLVLDCFMGSGSTGVACVNTGRDFIGIELDKNYFEVAKQRIKAAQNKVKSRLF